MKIETGNNQLFIHHNMPDLENCNITCIYKTCGISLVSYLIEKALLIF